MSGPRSSFISDNKCFYITYTRYEIVFVLRWELLAMCSGAQKITGVLWLDTFDLDFNIILCTLKLISVEGDANFAQAHVKLENQYTKLRFILIRTGYNESLINCAAWCFFGSFQCL